MLYGGGSRLGVAVGGPSRAMILLVCRCRRRTGTHAAGAGDDEKVSSCGGGGAGSCWRSTSSMAWTYILLASSNVCLIVCLFVGVV